MDVALHDPLAGRVELVTGAARDIGTAIANVLAGFPRGPAIAGRED